MLAVSKQDNVMVLGNQMRPRSCEDQEETERCTSLSKQRAPGPQLPATVPAGDTCTVHQRQRSASR